MYIRQFLILLASLAVTSCGSVPGITKCSLSDSKCIVDSGNKFLRTMALGLPEHGVEPVEPHDVKKVDLSSPNLNLIISDLRLTGFQNTVIQDIKIDKSKNKLVLKLRLNLQIEGKYDMNGNLTVFPLEGKGPLHVTVRNMDIVVNTIFKDVQRNGKTHWEITYRDFTYVLKDRSTVVFENLFDGNELLGWYHTFHTPYNKYLVSFAERDIMKMMVTTSCINMALYDNDIVGLKPWQKEATGAAKEMVAASGNEIIEEVGAPLITDVAVSVVNEINDLFMAIPASDLSLDY